LPKPFWEKGERVIIDFSTGEPELETYGRWSVDGARNIAAFLDVVAGLSDEGLERLNLGVVHNSFAAKDWSRDRI